MPSSLPISHFSLTIRERNIDLWFSLVVAQRSALQMDCFSLRAPILTSEDETTFQATGQHGMVSEEKIHQ